MKFFTIILFCLVFILFISCDKTIKQSSIPSQNHTVSKKEFSEKDLKLWYHKDIVEDSIPGISMERAYNSILKNKKGKEVIIASIDKGVDIYHPDLKNYIWINSDEGFNNGIDDDDNGYVDDVNGWNFSGNSEKESNKFNHYDYVRIVKAYNSIFKGKELEEISAKDSLKFLTYKRSEYKLNQKLKSISEEIEYAENVFKWKNESRQVLSQYFNTTNYDIKKLDSIKVLFPKDSVIQLNIQILSGFITQGYTDDYIKGLKLSSNNLLSKQLNLRYNERETTGDNSNDITDKKYGNANINSDINFFTHGTIVAGVLTKNVTQIKLMPLCISGFGSKHDKDIALAIRYAVNNGAKVINMSFGKSFSLYKHWVDDALKYAEQHNVLVVAASGNDYHNLDNPKKYFYPDDRDINGNEFVDNFLKVGGSTHKANKNLISEYSNYGKVNVDVFAPADQIYTTIPNNEYKYDSGTSLASATTAKVAALIYSYYPNLTASQVKHIIMDSGVEYTFPVKTPSFDDEDRMTPFNKLSKSGKIVNVYNALLMAEKISKN